MAAAAIPPPQSALPGIGLPPPAETVSFSAFFPPPYRVLVLVSIGLILFGSNFHLLSRRGIDLWSLIRERPPSRADDDDVVFDQEEDQATLPTVRTEDRRMHSPLAPSSGSGLALYSFGVASLVWSLLGWFSYRYYVDHLDGDPKGRHAQALQGIAVIGAFAALLWPGNVLNRPMRRAFGRATLRILTPSLSQTITFADVLLADVMTSFAKVLGDVWLTACFLAPRAEHHTWWNGKGSAFVPILISLPYAIRLRQCISEYFVTNSVPARPLTGSRSATNKKPLWNAAKYASAFPVIWLSAWYDADSLSGEWNAKFTLWLLAVFVNSIYSFWWDVTNDWGLTVLQPFSLWFAAQAGNEARRPMHKRGVSSFSMLRHNGRRTPQEQDGVPMYTLHAEKGDEMETDAFLAPSSSSKRHARQASLLETVLRPPTRQQHSTLLFSPAVYQVAILLDLVLRFFWSLKLSSHLHHVVEWQGSVFLIEALEVMRRWVWVFFRVEWEVVRRGRMTR